MCFFCAYQSTENDVHHVYYPPNLMDAKLSDLRVLCRRHHTEVHKEMEAVEKFSTDQPKRHKAFRIWGNVVQAIYASMRKRGEEIYARDGAPSEAKPIGPPTEESFNLLLKLKKERLANYAELPVRKQNNANTYKWNLKNAVFEIEFLKKKLAVLQMSTLYVDGDIDRVVREFDEFYRRSHPVFMRLIDMMICSKERNVLPLVKKS